LLAGLIIERVSKYEVCLPDTEAILPELAKIINADYHSGAFAKAEDDFHGSGKEIEEWSMIGKTGITLSVLFEKYEGYYFVTICGSGSRRGGGHTENSRAEGTGLRLIT
jgi:hypothetical protein